MVAKTIIHNKYMNISKWVVEKCGLSKTYVVTDKSSKKINAFNLCYYINIDNFVLDNLEIGSEVDQSRPAHANTWLEYVSAITNYTLK